MYIFPFIRIRYIKTITINTHIDCSNNSKCSVRDILLATKQGAFESVFGTFSVNNRISSKDSICLLVTCVMSYNFVSLYTKNRWVINVMGSPINVGGGTPSSHFSPYLGLVVNFCYGVMKPVLPAGRVLGSSPHCLSFVHCVEFVRSHFSRRWAAYVELAGIVPLRSIQGHDSCESCKNSRVNRGSQRGG